MSFFERFFGALDGADPTASLDYVAERMQFAIFWTTGSGRESEQFVGGKPELREFVAAGGVRPWRHHLTRIAAVDGVEMAVGETRYHESGERAATFVAAAELDDDGRITRYVVARTPALGFAKR